MNEETKKIYEEKKKRIKRPGGMDEKKKGCEKNPMKRKRNG
jgi:hypothetical protein